MTTDTNTTTHDDPFNAAMNAKTRNQEKHFFGEVVTVDPWFATLKKGVGKAPFDSTHDSIDDRVTVIKLQIECTKRDLSTYTIDQETVDFEAAWTQVTLPSLVKLNVSLRDLKGAFVQVSRKETGETFVGRDGSTKKKNGLHFDAVYQTHDEMQAAAEELYGGTRKNADESVYTGMPDGQIPDPPQNSMDPMKKFALESLPRLWEQARDNQHVQVGSPEWNTAKDKFAEMLKSTGFDAHYPITHRHTIAIMNGIIHDEDLPF